MRILITALLFGLFGISCFGQITYTVNSADFVNDGVCDTNHCSLIEAINIANTDGVISLIEFNIPGNGPHIIKPTLSFFSIIKSNMEGDIINGLSQPGNDPMNNLIVIDDSNMLNSGAIFCKIDANNSSLKGISFKTTKRNFGLKVESSNSSIIEDCSFDIFNNGLWISNSDNTKITNCNFENASNTAIWIDSSSDNTYISKSLFNCNINNPILSDYVAPMLLSVRSDEITGMSNPFDVIEIYRSNQFQCSTSVPHQGDYYLGSTISDPTGNWNLNSSSIDINPQDILIATAKRTNTNTSAFSNGFIVLPDVCELSEELSLNVQPCSTTGIVLDLKELTDSGTSSTSSCVSTYQSNDAWLKVEVPSTGNFLVRQNLNNTVNAVVEAYSGDCDNLFLEQCADLDSIPHSIVFENYAPGSTVYLRVWDKDNTVVNSTATALLHLTAHELPLIKDDWELCDEENNYLVNGNPTILSERDANTAIVEYTPDATPAEVQIIRDSLIANGGTLIDSCLCGSVNPIELWDHDDPIDLEGNRRSLRGRAKVDTSNYNYVFEAIEFQVNAYAIGEQYNAKVAMDNDGNFVIVWIDQQRRHNYARVYKSSGNPVTQEFQIGASNKTQYEGEIAMDDNGDFVTVWQEINSSIPGATFAIYGRQYYADGTPKGAVFEISETSACANGCADPLAGDDFAQFGVNPSIATDGSGNFAAVWHVGDKIWLQRYDSSASRVGNLIEVSPNNNKSSNPNPAVSMNNSGEFIIAWNGEDTDNQGIYTQRYNANGSTNGTEILVNTYTTDIQDIPTVGLSDDGSFVVSWESHEQEGVGLDYGIYAQQFDNLGQKVGSEIHVNTYTVDAQRHPSLSVMDDGTFFIAWDSYGQDGFEEGIFGQFFDNTGTKIGSEFQLNSFDDPEQEKPSTATNGSSVVIGSWEDGANDGSFKGIFGQRYEIIDAGGQKVFYPIGTATPSTLLGDELTYPGTIYTASDSLSSVRVAIIDTGVDPNHPYLSGAIWNNQQVNDPNNCYVNDTLGYDFVNDVPNPIDYDGHGTKVNGIIARDFPSDIRLELMNLKFHEFQKGKVFDAVCAIYYAVDNGADIINMSWGFEASEFPAILKKAIQYASDNDVLMVTTAGNTSKDNDKLNKFPNNFDIDNLIRVTSYEYKANTNTRKLANYASFGKNNVDIAAYGFVETPTLGDTLALASGTSLAAPHITRTAAIIKGLFPNLTAADIKDCILNSAAAEADFTDKVATGGILDHDAAIDCAYDKAANCVAIDLYITIPQTMDTVYRSDAWVETDATVTSNSDVEMYGAESVTMLPGFETTAGTEFLADIDDCDPLNAPLTTGSEEEEVVFRMRDNSIQAGKIKMQFLYQGAPIEISITNPQSGKIIEKYRFQPDSPGWYEKIIDAKLIKSGVYEIQFDNTTQLISKNIQVINKHYNKYIKRQKIKSED